MFEMHPRTRICQVLDLHIANNLPVPVDLITIATQLGVIVDADYSIEDDV